MNNVFSKLRNNIFDPIVPPQELDNRYGIGASIGYQMSGGATNRIPQLVQGFMQKNKLPGQTLVNSVVRKQQSNPTYQIKQKMQTGQPLTNQENNLITDRGQMMIGGITYPLAQSRLTPRYKFGQMVRNIESKDPKIGMSALEQLDQMVNTNLPKRLIQKINKTNVPGSARTNAFIDALDYRLPNIKQYPRRLKL